MPRTEFSRSQPIGHKQVLRRLYSQFKEFRKSGRLRARVPQELRVAVLGAIESGVPEAEVRVACGVSRKQLRRWQEVRGHQVSAPGVPDAAQSADPPKVLSVVDNQTIEHCANDIELNIRLGPWIFDLRLTPVPPAER